MEKLPEALLIDILSRLDSANVARCRVASKIFDNVYPQLRCINLKCTLKPSINSRYRLSIPIKKVFLNLISNMKVVESVCIGIDEIRGIWFSDIKHINPNLTHGDFIKEWLPKVSENLKSLSITDFWEQSLWWPSNVLQLVSAYCHKLVELRVKHAWLSADHLNPMPMLTSLTLVSVTLDDDRLTELNKCVPNLQVLNLLGVKGLQNPKIHLLNLKSCHLSAADVLQSMSLITPKLVTLRLKGISLSALYVEAPMLSQSWSYEWNGPQME
ncbi:hypothetical protein CTI12_AA321680 [Artemisia annua]|uniref:F-box domain-containing protein n=1 Tax=Artemisia annua TaxID=35608 RepID=A0A2U1N003_ARTAN|nr:hypothetical protein CTI12_AA321680 [Artemisia annua]